MTSATVEPRAERLPREGQYQWVGIWGLPLRMMHWVAALSIVVLAVTGLYIGKPYFIAGGDTASHFLMGWFRMIHFIAAGLLVVTAIVRIYWLFAGNRYERWRALVPVRPKDFRNMLRRLRSYVMIRPEEEPKYLGHNPMQQFSYTSLYAVAFVQVLTGFALYGQSNPSGIFYAMLNWVGPLFGGMPNVRFVHHIFTWVFAIFVPIHVYLSIRADILEHGSVISSMISGGRIVAVDDEFEDE
jgi:Ni/Fe-hydrogenase 1 B-type cytochrome subunit